MLHTRTSNHTICLSTDNLPRQPRRLTIPLQQACKLTAMGTRLKQWVTSNIPRLPPHTFSTHSSQHLVPTSGHLRVPVLTTTTRHRPRGLFRHVRLLIGFYRRIMAYIPACEPLYILFDIVPTSTSFECNVSSRALDIWVQQ